MLCSTVNQGYLRQCSYHPVYYIGIAKDQTSGLTFHFVPLGIYRCRIINGWNRRFMFLICGIFDELAALSILHWQPFSPIACNLCMWTICEWSQKWNMISHLNGSTKERNVQQLIHDTLHELVLHFWNSICRLRWFINAVLGHWIRMYIGVFKTDQLN